MIELFLYLLNRPVDKEILLLVETAVRISELLYMEDVDRNPRNILRLYNCTWIHHELCRKLITTLHGSMTYTKLFGLYLHALVVHAPQQLEIISLRSVNTENQERIFEQARRSATASSNRHPNNILTTIILRLQAKAAFRTKTDAAQAANSIVARAGKEVPKYKGTILTTDFLNGRIRSWQSHLMRISHYLLPGKGVWWDESTSGFHFFDGEDDATTHPEGPHLRHYRSTSLKEVTTLTKPLWEQILERGITLPSPVIQRYDNTGQPISNNTYKPGLTDSVHEVDKTKDDNWHSEINPSSESSSDTDEDLVDSQPPVQPSISFTDEGITSQPPKEATACYTTKHAQEISKVLGDMDEVKEFDTLRERLKSQQRVNRVDKVRHQQLLYKLQLLVQCKRTTLLEKLHSLEQQYFI